MTSMREERLQERVAEIRPQLAKAREIAEKAETENREMTAEEIEAQRWSVASQLPRSELHLASSPRTIRTTLPAGCGECCSSILRFRCPETGFNANYTCPAADQGAPTTKAPSQSPREPPPVGLNRHRTDFKNGRPASHDQVKRQLKWLKSPPPHYFWPLPVRSRYAFGTA